MRSIGVAAWGDSLTQSGDDSTSWIALLGRTLGMPFYNGGGWGQSAEEVAARQGSMPTAVTLEGGQVLANGAARVNEMSVDVLSPGRLDEVSGSLAGVLGTLKNQDGVTTFQRSFAGSPATVESETTFSPSDAMSHRTWTQIIWVGRNAGLEDPADVVERMIAYGSDRYLVIEIPDAEGWPNMDAVNAELESEWPENYVAIPSLLATPEAAQIARITFTPDDEDDIAAGFVPRSFRDDEVHLNIAGRAVVAELLKREFVERGWA